MASNVANTQGERAASATANRWTTRDVLTFVIFNIVIIVATMVVKLAEDAVLSPQNTFFVGSWLFPLVSTPFYLVMADRIGKRGVLGGSILLFGVLYTFMGGLYCAPVAVVGAVIGELVMWGKMLQVDTYALFVDIPAALLHGPGRHVAQYLQPVLRTADERQIGRAHV